MNSISISAIPRWVSLASRVIRNLPAGRYRLTNWLCRNRIAPFWARMNNTLGGHFFSCDVRDTIAREVCFSGRYEPQETALVQRLLQPGMSFLDVGANWG